MVQTDKWVFGNLQVSDEVMAHVCLLRLTQNSKLVHRFLILALGNCKDLNSSAFNVRHQTNVKLLDDFLNSSCVVFL